MIKIIGHFGAQSLGFSPNSLPAFSEGLECGHGVMASLGASLDGEVFCINDISNTHYPNHSHSLDHKLDMNSGHGDSSANISDQPYVTYNLAQILCEDSALMLKQRRLDECMADEIARMRTRNGERIVRLSEFLAFMRSYPTRLIMLDLRGEDVGKKTVPIIAQAIAQKHITASQLIISGYDAASVQLVKSSLSLRQNDLDEQSHDIAHDIAHDITHNIAAALQIYPENFPKGVKLFPWSIRNFGCFMPFDMATLQSPLIKRLSANIFSIEATAIRESTMRNLNRHFPDATTMLWMENEPRPSDNFTLIERLKNNMIAPHIGYVLTKYPREMADILYKEGLVHRHAA